MTIRFRIAVLMMFGACLGAFAQTNATAQESPPNVQDSESAKPVLQLKFSFDGAHWREVLRWLSVEADLALHVDQVPTGITAPEQLGREVEQLVMALDRSNAQKVQIRRNENSARVRDALSTLLGRGIVRPVAPPRVTTSGPRQ